MEEVELRQGGAVMYSGQYDIIILKPTRAFLSFLRTHIPEALLPALKDLQKNNTAYVIQKQEDDEATLNEIERHFVTMYRHEIQRAIKRTIDTKIEGTFLDFLCCFKIEMHSQVLLLEDNMHEGKQLVRIKPRSVLLKWMRLTADKDPNLASLVSSLNLAQLTDNATVIVKNFGEVEADINAFMHHYYQEIYEAEMVRLSEMSETWPSLQSYHDFNQYFTVTAHPELIHLHEISCAYKSNRL